MASSENWSDGDAVEVVNTAGAGPVVLVCEHASPALPARWGDLGLAEADRYAHAVWDPGAADLARALSARLDAALVLGRVSRLVHDCNRPAGAPSACPDRVERIEVPGNRSLTDQDRAARAEAVYAPFHRAVAATLSARTAPVMVTVHSFSPTWFGTARDTEIGLLHDADARLAQAMRDGADGFAVALNEPYSAEDGVTHTLARHEATASVMIEVRNDLLDRPEDVTRAAEALSAMLCAALTHVAFA